MHLCEAFPTEHLADETYALNGLPCSSSFLLRVLLRYLQRRRDAEGGAFSYEVIVVDDGSTDSTVHQAFEHVQRHGFDALRVLQLARNHGKVCGSDLLTCASLCRSSI